MSNLFKVPLKVHHGLLLVTHLAERFDVGTPTTLEEVADKEQISQGFLEEIAALLRSGGIIEGRRGPSGGYLLVKNPAHLTVADVIAAIDGPLALVDCLDGNVGCMMAEKCTSRGVWAKVQKQITSTLTGMTISDVIDRPANTH